jgi:hypothetical protein
MRKSLLVALAMLASFVCVGWTQAAIQFTGAPLVENFDTLPNAPTNTSLGNSPVGWTDDTLTPPPGNFSYLGAHLYHPATLTEGGSDMHERMRLGNGSANTGAFWSYGPTGSTDRALSSLASNATVPTVGEQQYLGLRYTNATASTTYTSVTIGYRGEQWRDGGAAAPNPQSLTFEYKLTASGAGPQLQDGGFTPFPLLNFTSPVFTNLTSGAAVDGNSSLPGGGLVIVGPQTITLTWLPGTDLWLRWTDINNSGNDHGLGIDNVEFSATPQAIVPEPASLAVWGCLVVLGMAGAKYFRQ